MVGTNLALLEGVHEDAFGPAREQALKSETLSMPLAVEDKPLLPDLSVMRRRNGPGAGAEAAPGPLGKLHPFGGKRCRIENAVGKLVFRRYSGTNALDICQISLKLT